jgi:hypothetical protein
MLFSKNVAGPSESSSFTASIVQPIPLDHDAAPHTTRAASRLSPDRDPQHFVASSPFPGIPEALQLPSSPSPLKSTPVMNPNYRVAQGPIYEQNWSSEYTSPDDILAFPSTSVPREPVVDGVSLRATSLPTTDDRELFLSI